jgi:hypothetical protein
LGKIRKRRTAINGVDMLNFKFFVIVLTFSIFISGCSLKLKTKEIETKEYQSVGNEISLFKFGLGENIHNIIEVQGKPNVKDNSVYSFADGDLAVFSDHQVSRYLMTTNPKFRVLKEISIGYTRNQLLRNFNNLDLYEYKRDSNNNSSIFFQVKDQKIVLEMKNDSVAKILIGSKEIPFEQMVQYNKKAMELKEYPDEEYMMNAKLLTFAIDYYANRKKLVSDKFLPLAKLGLIEGIPVPLGMDKNELTYRFGTPNYVFKGKGNVEYYYFYNRFNLYMGFNEENQLIEYRLPVNITRQIIEQEQLNIDQIESYFKETFEDYALSAVKNGDDIYEVIISVKKRVGSN